MKSKVLLATLALATAATTANAMPVALSDLRTAPIVRISGATAPDNTFNEAFLLNPASATAGASAIFIDTTIRRFEGSADGDDFTITCGLPTASVVGANGDATAFIDSNGNAATLSSATPLCIQKVAHGSGQGTGNVGNSIALNFADLTKILSPAGAILQEDDGTGTLVDICDAGTVVNASATNSNLQDYTLHSCRDVDTDFVPDCGVADVEPALFNEDPTLFDSGSTIDIPWGLQASLPLYFALQAVQFAGTDCDPGEAGYASASDNTDGVRRVAECQPSLSLGVIRSIFSNDLVLADELRDDKGNPLRLAPDLYNGGVIANGPLVITGVTQDDSFAPIPGGVSGLDTTETFYPGGDGEVSPVPAANADTNHLVYLCRRKNSSGTQASFEAKFLRQRCEPGVTMATGNMPGSFNLAGDNSGNADFLGTGGTLNVYENDGSSDVTQCMDQATIQNVWAIGINSTEKVSGDDNVRRDAWEHVKIDGVSPTSLNVTKGYHPFFSSVAGNTRAGEDSSGGAPELCREAVFDSASSAAVISGGLAPRFTHGWGQGGALASADKAVNNLPIATYAGGLTEAELTSNPVNQFSVATSGSLNNCAVPTKIPSPNLTDIIPAGAGLIQ